MKKNRRWGILVSGFLLCLAVGLAWQLGLINTQQVSESLGTKNGGQTKQLEKKTRTVGVVHPYPVTEGVVITFPGRARASQKATLFFREIGRASCRERV